MTPLATQRARLRDLAVLALVAGAPAIPGAVLGASVTNPELSTLLLGFGVGAIVRVVVVLVPAVRPRPGGSVSPAILAGIAGGVLIMYATGLLVTALSGRRGRCPDRSARLPLALTLPSATASAQESGRWPAAARSRRRSRPRWAACRACAAAPRCTGRRRAGAPAAPPTGRAPAGPASGRWSSPPRRPPPAAAARPRRPATRAPARRRRAARRRGSAAPAISWSGRCPPGRCRPGPPGGRTGPAGWRSTRRAARPAAGRAGRRRPARRRPSSPAR